MRSCPIDTTIFLWVYCSTFDIGLGSFIFFFTEFWMLWKMWLRLYCSCYIKHNFALLNALHCFHMQTAGWFSYEKWMERIKKKWKKLFPVVSSLKAILTEWQKSQTTLIDTINFESVRRQRKFELISNAIWPRLK